MTHSREKGISLIQTPIFLSASFIFICLTRLNFQREMGRAQITKNHSSAPPPLLEIAKNCLRLSEWVPGFIKWSLGSKEEEGGGY